MSGPRPQRGLPAAQLLPALALELAGDGEGDLSGSRRRRLALRARDSLAQRPLPVAEHILAVGMWVILLTLIIEPPLTPVFAKRLELLKEE